MLSILLLLFVVWIIPIGLSLATVNIIDTISTHSSIVDFTAQILTVLIGDVLGFIGALTAILIAVFTWIYTQSRNSRDSGFTVLRDGTNRLEILAEKMRQNLGRASPQDQTVLQQWAGATDLVVQQLNPITKAWRGWTESQSMEDDLKQYVELPLSFGNTVHFLVQDPVWSEIRIDSDHQIRNVLIGLLSMDRGITDYKLFGRLLKVFISLIMFVGITLVVRLLADMLSLTSDITGFVSASLGTIIILLAFAHVLWLAWSVLLWWKQILKQDKVWESN